ncbi:MAG: MFS transporter, partial [Pseudomonadota bacterium]
KMLAYVGVAPIVGGLAHRLSRRSLLIGLDISRAALIVCLPFASEIWHVYVLIFLLSACSAGFTPIFQATIPDVLPDDAQYTRALSLSRLAYDLENLFSPALAGIALLFFTYNVFFLFNAIAFGVSAVLIYRIEIPGPKPRRAEGSAWHNISMGLLIYLATPRLRGLLALSFAVAMGGAMVIVNTVIYVRDFLGGSEIETTIAFSAAGAGSMLVALLIPRWVDRVSDRYVMIGGSLLTVIGLLIGLSNPSYLWFLTLWFFLGVATSMIQTPAGRLLKRSATESDRAGVFSAQFALSHACWLLAYLLAGWIGSGVSPQAAFGVLAVLTAVSTGIAVAVWPTGDPVVLRHHHPSHFHEHEHVHDQHHQHEHEGWEGPEPHRHPHRHKSLWHSHEFVIDRHHPIWPSR